MRLEPLGVSTWLDGGGQQRLVMPWKEVSCMRDCLCDASAHVHARKRETEEFSFSQRDTLSRERERERETLTSFERIEADRENCRVTVRRNGALEKDKGGGN